MRRIHEVIIFLKGQQDLYCLAPSYLSSLISGHVYPLPTPTLATLVFF